MKKLLITLILMSVLPATLRSDDDIAREIRIKSVEVTTRSIVSIPEATIFKDILSVSFDDSGFYSLYVESSFGDIVYSSTCRLTAWSTPTTFPVSEKVCSAW